MFPSRKPTIPIMLYVHTPVQSANDYLWLMTAIACEPWNAIQPCFQFVDVTHEADAVVRWGEPGSRTWVDVQAAKPTIYIQPAPSGIMTLQQWRDAIEGWMPHELGHLLGFADHVRANTDLTGYHNPFVEESLVNQNLHKPLSGYHGIMSYLCNRSEWFGPDDRAALNGFDVKPGWMKRG